MSRRVAFGGIFSAISFLMIYFSGVIPTGKLALLTVSSFPVAFMLIEFGVVASITVFLTAGLLAYIILGNLGNLIPFGLFFGYYGIAKYYIEKVKNPLFEILLKLALFNAVAGTAYFLYTSIFASSIFAGIFENPPVIIVATIAALQAAFIMYDYIFSRVIAFYMEKMRHLRH